jgi:hypothetical protein
MIQQASHERRMSHRVPTTLNMQVYAYGMLVASGVGVEMSEHGLLIRIEQDYSDDELDPGKNLDVMLENCQPAPVERWLPIKVVRKWEEGIAARFVGIEDGIFMH